MTTFKKSLAAFGFVLSSSLLFPLTANAERITVTGFINTLSCAEEGTVCPIDKLDPHIAAARDFVVQERQVAGEYYFLSNLPRETKARYVLEEVQITGDLNKRYNAIKVDEFRVKRGDAYRTVWSPRLQAREWAERTQPGASRP